TDNSEEIVVNVEDSLTELQAGKNSFDQTAIVMDEFLTGLKQMGGQFSSFKTVFADVQNATLKIRDTVHAIADISELTNLLSINAAIEAARAGEHGKGFKVVSDEVKKLAEQSKKLTSDISGLLKTLEKNISSSENNLLEYEKVSNRMNDKVEITRTDLSSTSQSLLRIDNNMTSIDQSVRNQSTNTERIYHYVGQLSNSFTLLNSSSKHIINNLKYQDDIITTMKKQDNDSKNIVDIQQSILKDIGSLDRSNEYTKVGHDVAYPPWVFIKEGVSSGLSVDIMKIINESLDLNLYFQPDQFISVTEGLLKDEIQIILNVGWPNDFLASKPIIVTNPYSVFKPVAFVHKDSHPGNDLLPLNFLNGKKIAAQEGSYTIEELQNYACEIVPVVNEIEALSKLIWKQVDGIITDRQVGNYLSRKYFQGEIVAVTEPYKELDVVMVLHKSNSELRDKINKSLELLSTKQKIAAALR
ncbi:MAG: methyl-accepting chemotaxis protein, partial [Spirochaetia bacterium]|nr:methyl-accepting chemotaxis protein [Spirochaetia bacterium]